MRSKLYLILFAHIIAFTANMLFLFLFFAKGLRILYSGHSGKLYHLLPFLITAFIGYIFTWLKPKWGALILIAVGAGLFLYYLATHDYKYMLWMFSLPFFLSGLFLLGGYQAFSRDRY